MIKTITICDKCGKEIGENGTQVFTYDLCEKCSGELLKKIKFWLDVDHRGGMPKKWDKGKAQALRNQGWSLADIAKECGVTEATICKHTTPAKPRKAKPNEWAQNEPDLPAALST